MSARTARCPHGVPWFRLCQSDLDAYEIDLLEELRIEAGQPMGSHPVRFFSVLRSIGVNREDDKAAVRRQVHFWVGPIRSIEADLLRLG